MKLAPTKLSLTHGSASAELCTKATIVIHSEIDKLHNEKVEFMKLVRRACDTKYAKPNMISETRCNTEESIKYLRSGSIPPRSCESSSDPLQLGSREL